MKPRCADCHYYVRHVPSTQAGSCHRYPPFDGDLQANGQDEGDHIQWFWPEPEPDNWCGEFVKKEQPTTGEPHV